MSSRITVYLKNRYQLGRTASLVLLALAMLDLVAPGLCQLDKEQYAAASAFGAATATVAQDTQSVPSTSGHVDDCFCCSRCVDLEPMPPVRHLVSSVYYPTPGPLALPPAPAPALDHPPQLHS